LPLFDLNPEDPLMARRSSAPSTPGKLSRSPPEALMQFVERFTYQRIGVRSPLTNIVFWAGAGFSKSWEPNSPTGDELFTLHNIPPASLLSTLAELYGTGETIPCKQFRHLVYQMEMFERYPDLRSRYFDAQNITASRNALFQAVFAIFNSLSPLYFIDDRTNKFPLSAPTKAQKDILRFFHHLQTRTTGDDGMTEGLRPQFITTNYDYVIETILDNVIPDDEDSVFHYTYRGITPTKVGSQRYPQALYGHWLVDHLLKLNGGFEILAEGSGYVLDYSNRSPEALAERPPVLILPSREQQYTDPYFRAIFPKAVRLMRESTVLVLVGYRLPEGDALIRFIIRQFAEEREDGFGKHIFYIDPGLTNEKKSQKLTEIFPWIEEGDNLSISPYEGGFAEFAKECGRFIPK
jgi:hypothetical protein